MVRPKLKKSGCGGGLCGVTVWVSLYGEAGCPVYGPHPPNKETDSTESITFPKIRWWAVINTTKRHLRPPSEDPEELKFDGGVLDFLNFVPIHARLDWVSRSNTMEMLTPTRYKTAKIGTIEHTLAQGLFIR